MKEIPALLCVPCSRLSIMLLATLTVLGCGGRRSEVSGTVTYQGKPLEIGTITFLDSNNQVLGSGAIEKGKYVIAKLPAGPVKIIVTTPPQVPNRKQLLAERKMSPKSKERAENKNLSPEEIQERRRGPRLHPHVVIPEKYGNPDQSGLTYTVQSGSQEHNIDLP